MRQFKKIRMWLGASVLLWVNAVGVNYGVAAPLSSVLVSAEPLSGPWIWSAKALEVSRLELPDIITIPRRTSILAFRLKYRTQNLKGESVVASGLVRIRSDLLENPGPITMISYQHSTRILRTDSPSESIVDPEGTGGVLYFASRGYLWAMPDYLGLGSNKDPQAYLHAHGQAVVCADFMKAVDEWARDMGLDIRREVYLMGYSQGGHSTLALQRYLESKENSTRFSVRASFPMAGPYSVAGVGLSAALQAKSAQQFLFVALSIYGLSNDPSLNIQLDDVIAEKYATILPRLLSGVLGVSQATAQLPKKAQDFFTPTFLTSMLSAPEDNSVFKALEAQDVLEFQAKAPVYLVHALDDEVVSYQNSLLAEKNLTKLGSRVTLITLPKKLNHVQAAMPAFSSVAKILGTLD